jgi:hypothetical protein
MIAAGTLACPRNQFESRGRDGSEVVIVRMVVDAEVRDWRSPRMRFRAPNELRLVQKRLS